MIADWWPDGWDFPVGYHVTVPCDAADAAYRSFHQAFGFAGLDAGGAPVLAYQQDLLRDGSLVDTNFGAGGLCRTTNFGMETLGVNTMRYCTQAPLSPASDYTVARETPVGAWGAWSCATSGSDVPWPDHTVLSSPNTNTYEPSLYSVGTIPNMPPDGADYYPNSLDGDTYDVGPWQDILADQGWGRACSDLPLAFCKNGSDCPATYTCEGLFCSDGDRAPCRTDRDCRDGACRGVCMAGDVECTQHADCAGGKMCTGLGECVTPLLTVLNSVSTDDMAFQVNAERCPASSTNYSMLGASYWAYVTNDVLRLHGQCSYGDWYKYQTMISQCNPQDEGAYWLIDPTLCHLIDLTGQAPNSTHWWEPSAVRPNVMFMHPTNCDRDYERLQLTGGGAPLQSCAPTAATVRSPVAGNLPLTFDSYAKTHRDTPAGPRIPIAKMPFQSDPSFGFLGIGPVASSDSIEDVFVFCSTLDQCTVSPFTVNGQPATRQYLPWNQPSPPSTALANFSQGDVFVCGVMGYQSAAGCTLDLAVSQLYTFYCLSAASKKCTRLVSNLALLCNNVQTTYAAGYANVVANVAALNALFYAVTTPPDVPTYLSTVDCMEDMYAFMSAQPYRNFYYVLDFVLYEFPFAWFYQCMVMSPITIDTTSHVAQDCSAFTDRAAFTIDAYTPRSTGGDDAMTMLRLVDPARA